jgi:hypothetical protein
LSADLRFFQEASCEVGPVAVLIQQHLQGECSAEVGVADLEDGAHPAVSNLLQDFIAAYARREGRCRRHRGILLLAGIHRLSQMQRFMCQGQAGSTCQFNISRLDDIRVEFARWIIRAISVRMGHRPASLSTTASNNVSGDNAGPLDERS